MGPLNRHSVNIVHYTAAHTRPRPDVFSCTRRTHAQLALETTRCEHVKLGGVKVHMWRESATTQNASTQQSQWQADFWSYSYVTFFVRRPWVLRCLVRAAGLCSTDVQWKILSNSLVKASNGHLEPAL